MLKMFYGKCFTENILQRNKRSLNVFITKDFVCWQNISSTNNFIFFYFFIKAWVDDSISSPTVSSPKDLCGVEIFCHQLFLFSFIFIFINYGVTLVFRHLKIYVGTKYCVTNYFYFFITFFFLLSYGVTILLCHLKYCVT